MSNILKDRNVIIDDVCISIEEINKHDEIRLRRKKVSEKKEIIPDVSSSDQLQKALSEAKLFANRLVEQAKEQAKKIKEEAELKAQREFEQSRALGYKQGQKEGKAYMDEKLEDVLDEFSEFMSAVRKEKQRMLKQYEDDLKNLALDIAKKIIDTELEASDEAFLKLYKSALRYHDKQEKLKLTVCGHEAVFATSNKDMLLSMAEGAQKLEIVVVEDAEPGLCILETNDSLIDASARTQFEKIKQSFVNT